MIKLLVFDLDDTLYSELDYVHSGFRAVADFLKKKLKLDAEMIFEELASSFEEKGRGKNFNDLAEKYEGIAVEELVKAYREHLPKIKITKDAEACLKKLKKDYTLCLLTNGWPEVQRQKVKALGLEKLFDGVFYAHDEGPEFAKPHPRFFEKILKEYGVKPDQALMVGDDPINDIYGAEQVGMHAFFIQDLSEICRVPEHLKAL